MMMMQNTNPEEEILEAFKIFDEDGSGSISKDELRVIMENLGANLSEDEITQMIEEADLDGDGEIDYNEFLHMMLSK